MTKEEESEKNIMTKEDSDTTAMTTTTKEDSEKTTMTKEDSEETKTPQEKKPTGTKPTVVAEKQQPPVYQTRIAARLDAAVLKGATSNVNRSSELVPLSQDFDQMRKRLRSLIAAVKHYGTASAQVAKARMEVTAQLSALSVDSPFYDYVGSTRCESLASMQQLVTQNANVGVKQYQKKVIDYAIEWFQIVTARVDDGSKKTNVLYQNLNHYRNKIKSLRKKVNGLENKGKESPAKLSEQLTRNEEKLKQAWKLHEASASTLCNLLEEVTKGGWKDFYPLVMAAMEWEVDRVIGEQDAYRMLSKVENDMTSTFDKHATVLVVDQGAKDLSGGSSFAIATGDSDSDTLGTPDVVSISSSDVDVDADTDTDDTFKTVESAVWI